MALEAVEAALRQLKLFLEKGNRAHLDKVLYQSYRVFLCLVPPSLFDLLS